MDDCITRQECRSKYDNLQGKQFYRLKVISEPIKRNGFRYYLCQCDCGNKKEIRADGLITGYVKSCGCYQKEVLSSAKPQTRKVNDYTVIDKTVYVKLSNSDDIMICDIEDWEKLKDHCWMISSDGYARTNYHKNDILKSKKFHIAIIGSKQNFVIDHINRNKLDNRKSNLRHVTKQANSVNYNLAKNNTTGVTGVYQRKDTGRWKTTIYISGKEIALGHFSTKEEAAMARKKAEDKYFAPLFDQGVE